MRALIISALPDAFLLRVVLQRKGFEVELSPTFIDVTPDYQAVIIDKAMQADLDLAQIGDQVALVLLSREPIDIKELKDTRVNGYIRLPFSLEFILSFVQELSLKFTEGDNKRSDIRFQIELNATLHADGQEDINCFIMDLSKGGFKARISSEEDAKILSEKENLVLVLKEKGKKIIESRFELRWLNEENGIVNFGGEWLNLSKEHSEELINHISINTGHYSF